MKSFLTLLSLVCIAFTISCGSDDEPSVDCGTLETQFGTSAAELITTAFAYGLDPSSDNCLAYKADLTEFISLSKSSRSCIEEADLADFDQNIAESESALADLPC